MIFLTSVGPFELSVPIVTNICPSELSDAVAQFTPEQLADLPEPSAAEAYTRRILIDTPELLVIAARWRAGARTDLHGHSESAGLYRVVTGTLEEERYVPAANSLSYFAIVLDMEEVNARINCNRASIRGLPQGFDSRVVFGVVR
jgi:hypothetical protein